MSLRIPDPASTSVALDHIILPKFGETTRLHSGSATKKNEGLRARMHDCNVENYLPVGVDEALKA